MREWEYVAGVALFGSDPDDLGIRFELLVLTANLKRYPAAIAAADRILAAVPEFAPALFYRGLARAALVDLSDASRTLLAECFRQFGIETVAMSGESGDRLHKEKFEACVLKLDCWPRSPILSRPTGSELR